MWSDSYGWVSFVEWVGVASLRRSREHVFDARNVGSRLCLVFREIEIPLHCDFALTHRWCSDAVGISRHAREIIGSRPEDFHLSVGIHLSDRGVFGHIGRTRGEGARNFALFRLLRIG